MDRGRVAVTDTDDAVVKRTRVDGRERVGESLVRDAAATMQSISDDMAEFRHVSASCTLVRARHVNTCDIVWDVKLYLYNRDGDACA